jgi:shikimate kinase
MTMNDETRALREIHEIREQLYEETKNLSCEQRAEKRNKIGKEIAEQYGLVRSQTFYTTKR